MSEERKQLKEDEETVDDIATIIAKLVDGLPSRKCPCCGKELKTDEKNICKICEKQNRNT